MIINKKRCMGPTHIPTIDQCLEEFGQITLMEVVAFLKKRANELLDADRIRHFREYVALTEAAILIENGEWKQ